GILRSAILLSDRGLAWQKQSVAGQCVFRQGKNIPSLEWGTGGYAGRQPPLQRVYLRRPDGQLYSDTLSVAFFPGFVSAGAFECRNTLYERCRLLRGIPGSGSDGQL